MTSHEHDDRVRESFRRQAALFEGDDSPFAAHSHEPDSPSWLQPLDRGMIVLDVACGAGHLAEEIAPQVRQVVGVDLTEELLAVGATRLRDAGISNVLLQQGSATALPFVDESFDVVCCRTAVHHFGDPDTAAAEMARVCRRGGRVVVSDLVVTDAALRGAYDAVHRMLDPSHARAHTADELEALVAAHVGPPRRIEQRTSPPFSLDHIMTDVADRDGLIHVLNAELAGGPPTGFTPTRVDGNVMVSFTSVAIGATRS